MEMIFQQKQKRTWCILCTWLMLSNANKTRSILENWVYKLCWLVVLQPFYYYYFFYFLWSSLKLYRNRFCCKKLHVISYIKIKFCSKQWWNYHYYRCFRQCLWNSPVFMVRIVSFRSISMYVYRQLRCKTKWLLGTLIKGTIIAS